MNGMSVVLLVQLEGSTTLYRVSTYEGTPFQVWMDRDGVDLFWKGREVDKVYSMGKSCDCWWSVPVTSAIRSLLRRGKATRVPARPLREGRLPS